MIPVKNWTEIEAIEREMRAAKGANILELFKIAKLDPRRDFRCQDWRFVTFDGLDLRGFDFERSRVFGSTFAGARVAGAKFCGSDVETTPFYLAIDWEQADLTDDQRDIIRVKAFAASGQLDSDSLTQLSQLKGLDRLSENQWVQMIKRAADFTTAHDIYRLMNKVGLGANKFAITTLLDKANSPVDVQIARSYFTEHLIPLDSYAVSTLISKAGSEREAREIFFRHKDSCEHTKYLYNSFLAKCDFLETAEDIFEMMRDDGIEIDAITLNPFIWKAQNFRSALWIYNKIPEPRTADLNALLSHAKWHQYFKGDKEALALISDGPPLDQRSFNVIIGTCDNLRDGLSVIGLMKQLDFKPDLFTLYQALNLIPNGDVDRCFDLLIRFMDDGVAIDNPDVVRLVVRIVNDATGRAYRIAGGQQEMDGNLRQTLITLAEAFASPEMSARFQAQFIKDTGSGQ